MKECPRCFACYEDERELCVIDGVRLAPGLEGPPLIDEKYRLEKRLGQGAMGVVFRARHLSLERHFALKLIRPNGEWEAGQVERFGLEARALGRLKHDHIVDVTDFGVDPRGGGVPYLVMEYLVGESLDTRGRTTGPLALEEAVGILAQVAQALDFAHAQGVIHRDLKPANVFLCQDGSGLWRVKLVDFGVARLLGASREPVPFPPRANDPEASTIAFGASAGPGGALRVAREGSTNSIAGTPHYMAPECLRRGEASVATDIYALGVFTYALLVGRCPFEGGVDAVVNGHLNLPPPRATELLPSLPPELDEVLLAPLAKDPAQRPLRASDLVSRLGAAVHSVRVREWRESEAPRRLAFAVGVLATVLVCAPWIGRARLLTSMEGWTTDRRLSLAPARAPDPRLVLVVLDEVSLRDDQTPLAQMADPVARQVERLFEAGVRSVALDLVLPAAWSRSEAFSRLVLGHPDTLTLAVLASPQGEPIGPEAIEGMTAVALGEDRGRALFGVVNVEEDRDGVIRRAPFRHAGPHGLQDAWATRAARTLMGQSPSPPASCGEAKGAESGDEYWLDQTVDWRLFRRLSWRDLPVALEAEPQLFRGALVLIGAEFAGSGDEAHRISTRSGSPSAVSGIVVQALAVNTVLEGFPIRALCGRVILFPVAFIGAGLFCGILLAVRPGRALIVVGATALLYSCIAVGAFLAAGTLVPLAVPLVLLGLGSALSLAVRSRLKRPPLRALATSDSPAGNRPAIPAKVDALPTLVVPEIETTERPGPGRG